MSIHHFGGNLADDDQAHYDGLLTAFVANEFVLAQALNEAESIGRRLPHMVEIVGKTVPTHTARASESTLWRNLWRQIAWRQQVDADAEQVFEFGVQTAKVEKRGPRQGVHQEIEIAAVLIDAAESRAKDFAGSLHENAQPVRAPRLGAAQAQGMAS